jgi:hypothetical protein
MCVWVCRLRAAPGVVGCARRFKRFVVNLGVMRAEFELADEAARRVELAPDHARSDAAASGSAS